VRIAVGMMGMLQEIGTAGKREGVGPKRQGRAVGCLLLLLVWIGTAECPAVSGEDDFQVRRVEDGDTLLLDNGRHVRLIGINAPEVAGKKKKEAPFGEEAAAFHRRLVSGKQVRLVFEEERTDRYGRWLAHVHLKDGTWVNQRLLQEGYAYLLSRPPNTKWHTVLLTAQRDAMTANRGIWPGILREEAPVYAGNRKSFRFHLPECPMAKRIHPKNRVVFHSKKEAFREGFSPASDCFTP